jgi:uncharacterized protein YjdB
MKTLRQRAFSLWAFAGNHQPNHVVVSHQRCAVPLLIAAIVVFGFIFTGCSDADEDTTVAVTGITLSEDTLELEAGETGTLSATVSPENATNKNVSWLSSDETKATVSVNAATGVATVSAVAAGTATITVTTADGDFEAECEVTVTEADPGSGTDIAVTGVTLSKDDIELEEGDVEVLTATIAPDNATNKNISWESSDDTVATVSPGAGGTATVSAVGEGTATITVITADGGHEAECEVKVNAADPNAVHVESVTVSPKILSLTLGGALATGRLSANITPLNADNKNVSWSSNNSAIASVSNGPTEADPQAPVAGTVTAHSAGNVVITVTTQDGGKTDTCAVSVAAAAPVLVTSVTLSETSLSMVAIYDVIGLSATVNPTNATNKDVTWRSSDDNVATVWVNSSGVGVIRGVTGGTATITVTTVGLKADGQPATATCSVTVNTVAVSGITLTKTSLILVKDRTEDLIATVAPDNATNQNVIWTSSDDNVATVSVNATTGVATVTGNVIGNATITVTTVDGGHKATCAVIVHSAGANNLLGKTYNIGNYTTIYNADFTCETTCTGNPKNEFKGTYTYDSTEKTLVTTVTYWRQDNGAWKTESEANWNEKDWFPTRTFKYEISGNFVLAQQIVTNAGSDELKGKSYQTVPLAGQPRTYIFEETGNTYTQGTTAGTYYYDETLKTVFLRPTTVAGKTMVENFTGTTASASATNSTYASLVFAYDAVNLKITQSTFQTNW